MQTPTFALPVAASEEAAAEEAAVEEAAVELEEPPQAVRTLSSTHNSRSLHKVTTGNHFHNLVLLHSHITASHGIYLHVCSMVSVCIITVWKIIRNGTSSQDSGHFFMHSSQLILLCTTFFFAIKYKISRKCNIHPNSMPKIHKSFQNGYNIVLFMQQISLYRKCPFFPGVLHKTYISGKNRAFFSFFTFLCVRGGSGWG